jgi:hypothetical protein
MYIYTFGPIYQDVTPGPANGPSLGTLSDAVLVITDYAGRVHSYYQDLTAVVSTLPKYGTYTYMYIYMYIHICIYTYVHIYMYMYIHVYTYICVHTYVYTYIYMRINIHTYKYVYTHKRIYM